MNDTPATVAPLRRRARFAAGLLALAATLGGQAATLSRDVHARIRHSLPTGGRRGPADVVYALVRGSLDLAADGLAGAGLVLADTHVADDDARLADITAALNGVCGDLLAARGNPLAQRMQLRHATPLHGDARYHLLFIHGLCMHDGQWQHGAHPAFAAQAAAQLQAGLLYLRYNSGLHISQNARELAAQLERLHTEFPGRQLVLVGHSMGGLLARAALQAGREDGMAWPAQVAALVALGSPHQGASLERLGNLANRQLRLLPWSAPFTRLGNLRSAGIRDLRWGNLRDSDWQGHDDVEHTADLRTPVPVPAGIPHLFVAATRTASDHPEQETRLAGDLLVDVDSALARGYPGTDAVERLIIPALDHMDLLWDARVGNALLHWLQRVLAPRIS